MIDPTRQLTGEGHTPEEAAGEGKPGVTQLVLV